MGVDESGRSEIDALRLRLDVLERSVADLHRHLRLAPPQMPGSTGHALEAEVVALLREGKVVQAVNLYRERAGVDLGTAKATVDDIRAARGI